MSAEPLFYPSAEPHVIVAPGRVLDFIDGVTQRPDTPEEYVRQEISKSLVREYGYSKADVAIEWPLKFGSRRVRADIAIFDPNRGREQSEARILIECKKSSIRPADRKEGVGQLQSYMAACPNVVYGMWTNGLELECFHAVVKDGVRVMESVPDIPRFGADAESEDRPEFEQLRPAASDSLLFAFRRAHDYIAGNQGLQKPDAFWELLKLIFCKIQDERQSERPTFYAAATERSGVNGPLKSKKRIDALFKAVKADYPQIFKPQEEIELSPVVLAYIVSQLQMFALLDSDVDVKGKAYEEIVGSNLRGDRGEFFTPRNICSMMVSMLDPSDSDIILDPACGTGGFLITAMNHVLAKVEAEVNATSRSDAGKIASIEARKKKFLERNLIGMDFNPSLVKASKMNMVMNNDGSGGLYQANSLASQALWSDELRARELFGTVDYIVTNPPFGSKIPIDDPAILDRFDLGHHWTYDEESDRWVKGTETKSRPPEILFIERCVELLKPGSGVAAMVLPDGILGSPGLGYVRQWLLDHTQILASVDLHADTFQPGTSVQTSVLVFRRKTADQVRSEQLSRMMNDYDIFMAICDHVGHDKRGNSIYVRDDEGNEIIEETSDVVMMTVDGRKTAQLHRAQERKVDDNTSEIAEAYRVWSLQSV
ncbi:N-6 DNA methylase (plasmid) [Paenarthrobacter sp. AT5]|uniref:N-6 DNA methylase n=1 Tax=Paenarthrobacter sp. AT5 TaxID=2973089 RepID=UPI00293461F7|nr:N-6 DNA methylase [Paenarthrobacter sp. AT5]WOC63436.1 N-6 DNA methylase [Paenarthrobacter sp. AT5]